MSHSPPNPCRIKICGVMRPQDARAAARAGADAIGMVFHAASRRNVLLEHARAILEQLPPFVTPVGVFVDADAPAILDLAAQLRLTHVQLNGQEPPELLQRLKPLRVLKAIKVDPPHFAHTLATWRTAIQRLALDHLVALVLEPAHTGLPGGSGMTNDWTTVQQAQRNAHIADLPPLIAAGGLTPESVADVVRAIRPYAVDVSSGVESSLGVKSDSKIRAFIAAVRQADV